eukprot:PITA_16410
MKLTKVDTLFDTSSQVNFISEEIFNKLGLEMKPHKKPYPIYWVCDNGKVQVIKQCKLKFSITSKFVDDFELDVVPLDIFRIVLGSPYFYDRGAIFFRQENKYHLTEVGVEYNELEALPPKREIQLQEGAPLPNVGMHKMSVIENVKIKKKLQELVEKGVVRPISSPCGSPIVMVPKKDGTWRICMEFSALNNIKVKNQYPLPRINDFLDQLKDEIYFTKIDL